jgi:hypothetical protein
MGVVHRPLPSFVQLRIEGSFLVVVKRGGRVRNFL